MKPKLYRLGVGVMLINADGKVWVGHRIDTTSDAWQMPQGGVDEGEDFQEAARRELLEETGITKASFIASTKDLITYDLPEELISQLWEGKYLGQKQKWFLAKFEGVDADVNINTETPEFKEWKWVNPQDLPDIIVPFKRELYEKVLAEFLPVINAL